MVIAHALNAFKLKKMKVTLNDCAAIPNEIHIDVSCKIHMLLSLKSITELHITKEIKFYSNG